VRGSEDTEVIINQSVGEIMKSLVESVQSIQKVNIIRDILTEDGPFPNNGLLPVLLYRQAWIDGDQEILKELLETNRWTNLWVDGIYDVHHFHSTAHEVLVALTGSARVQFGGPNGITLDFEKGDVVIIPAGVAHKKIDESNGFACLGAYPEGQEYDMHYGKPEERPDVDNNIRNVPLPENDPLYGSDGPLIKNWLSEREQKTDGL
jgi:uncharacterized protein YjlB